MVRALKLSSYCNSTKISADVVARFSGTTFSTRENGREEICIIIVMGIVGDAGVTINVMDIASGGSATGEEAFRLFFTYARKNIGCNA